MKKLLVVLFIVAAAGVCAQQNANPQKYALVIGNGNYINTTKLNNPVNDANDMEAALRKLDFTVEKLLNASQEQMESAVLRLKRNLSRSQNSYGFLFYAGHGVQSNGENYLIPVDANIPSENHLRNRAVSVQTMLDDLNDAGNSLNIVVLDACRNNPFSWSRSGSRGLTLVNRQPADSIIVFATSAQQTASDGEGRNGLFTSQLLKNIQTPGLEVSEIFRRTGAAVSEVSGKQQIPAVYNQFFGTAYLSAAPSRPAPAPSQPVTVVSAPRLSASSAAGSINVTSEIAGMVMIDGAEIGSRIKAGGNITVTNVSAGATEVAVKTDDGKVTKAPQPVMVRQGQTASVSIMEYVKPNWVANLPQSSDRMAYFVGRSERMENYENYLEARAGALMDVLMQFSIYKGAEVKAMFTDYIGDGKNMQEDITRFNAANSSAGLYQQAEWMADDGTLNILYTYSSAGRTNPRPDFPVFFRDIPLENGRIYFVAKSVSVQSGDLHSQAETNARIQALLWLGANITGLFTDYQIYSDTNSDQSQYFEGSIKCTSRINMQRLSFKEDARHVQMEHDKKYHFYGLYSISAGRTRNAAEYELFTYQAKYGDTPNETFEKQINFNGTRFTRNTPYPAIRQTNTAASGIPQPINDWMIKNIPEDVLAGIGVDKNTSAEIQNIRAAMRAVTAIARQLDTAVQRMVTDYNDQAGKPVVPSEEISRSLTTLAVSKFIKTHNVVSEDGTSWQVWQTAKSDVKKIINDKLKAGG